MSSHALKRPASKNKWWLTVAVIVVLAAVAVTLTLVLPSSGTSISYRFGYEAGVGLARDNDPDTQVNGLDSAKAGCTDRYTQLANLASLGSDTGEIIGNVELHAKDVNRADYIAGCVKGALAYNGLK